MAFEEGLSVLTGNATSASAEALWLHDALADGITRAASYRNEFARRSHRVADGQLLPIRPPERYRRFRYLALQRKTGPDLQQLIGPRLGEPRRCATSFIAQRGVLATA